MKLEISLFKFDYKSDYLPYYTKHILKMESTDTLLDVLKKINEDFPLSFECSNEAFVVLNGLYTNVSITCKEIKENFGKDLTVEPLSIRRSYKDLSINEDDFNEKLNILNAFIDEEDKKTYQSYKSYFYASNTMRFEYSYIGDALLLLASDLITKSPNDEKGILKALLEADYGIEYHTDLTNRVYNFDQDIESKISVLKEKLNISKSFNEQNFRVNNTKILDFGTFEASEKIEHDFKKFNIAYYKGKTSCSQTEELLNNLNAKILDLPTLKDCLATDTFHINPNFTYKLASNMMLDAFDNNADLIIVDNDQMFYLLDYNRKNLEKISGREIIIPVLHKNELEKLANGEHEKVRALLEEHIVNPEII